MIKKGQLYYPDAIAIRRAWLKSKNVYSQAEKNPVKLTKKIENALLLRGEGNGMSEYL